MPTVILGGGIIGSSIAYYLSGQQPTEEIHIIESSSQLFSAASGYAAGFLARDWFAPSLAPLGALSFDLHHALAKEHGGYEKWGYMKGTALSLNATSADGKKGGARGDDWLRAGTSRAETASGSPEIVSDPPSWLTKQKGTSLEKISDEETSGVVDPLKLSSFLMDSSLSRGAKLHQPAKAASVITDATTGAITGVKILNINTGKEYTIPCTNLVICTGAWAPHTFNDLFPSTRAPISVSPLAGYSLVFRSPRYTQAHGRETYGGRSHAVFTTHPVSCGFSPEIFSRHGGDIYIAGLNSWDIPLPARAEETSRLMDKAEMDKLKAVAVRLMGRLPGGTDESTDDIVNTDDLEVVREGLCFRPVTKQGTPIVSKVAPNILGNKAKAGSSGKGGVFVATGHGPWGISLALGTGKVVAEMIQGGRTSADVSGLGIEVPAKASL